MGRSRGELQAYPCRCERKQRFSSFNLGVFHNLMLGSARFLKLAALRPVLENYMRMLHAKVPVQRPGLQGIVGTLCLLPIKAADFSLGDFRKLGTEQYTRL